MSVAVVSQFVLDHLQRNTAAGLQHELPPALDARLKALATEAKSGHWHTRRWPIA